jgi:hypothetical protein
MRVRFRLCIELEKVSDSNLDNSAELRTVSFFNSAEMRQGIYLYSN